MVHDGSDAMSGGTMEPTALHSEAIDQLATALAQAQAKVLVADKDGLNPHFKSKFSTLQSVWEACRKPLAEAGIAVFQVPVMDGDTQCLDTMLVHKSGQWMRGRLRLNPVKNDPQGVGSALSYCRRYALAAMVGIVADEDDDGNAASKPDDTAKAPSGQALTRLNQWIERIRACDNLASLEILGADIQANATVHEKKQLHDVYTGQKRMIIALPDEPRKGR